MNRRQLITTTAIAGAAIALSPLLLRGFRRSSSQADAALAPGTRVLKVVSRTLDINGKPAPVFGLAGPDGKPGLTFTEGERFQVALINKINEPTIIHWHGLKPPFDQDGTPNAPMPLLTGGEIRHYDFPVGATGTHWMHAHTLQEQNLLAAPLIVRAKDAANSAEQEVVILLHDFSFTPAQELLARLRKGGNMGGENMSKMDMSGMKMNGMTMDMPGMKMDGMTMDMPGMDMGGMKMDLNDIEYDAYLANDRTLDDPEVVKVERGGKVRLRIINGAASTVFTIDTGEVDGTLLAVDGLATQPVVGRRFPVAMGQRLDIALTVPADGNALPILALREGAKERAGIILAPTGAVISKMAAKTDADGPVMTLDFESRLRAANPLAAKVADRTLRIMLMGNMMTYQWMLMPGGPLMVKEGERVNMVMANHTEMAHPMHLHGHAFQVVGINGAVLSGALRDTVQIPPKSEVTVAFDADHPGKWAFHCHHLYHMESGMMSSVGYEGVA